MYNYEFVLLTSDVQIFEKLAHVRNYYEMYIYMFEVHNIVLLLITYTLYTSQYRSRTKEIHYYL